MQNFPILFSSILNYVSTQLSIQSHACTTLLGHLLATCVMVSILMVLFFFKQEDGVNITANSLHPGSIVTNLFRYNGILRGDVSSISCCDQQFMTGLQLTQSSSCITLEKANRCVVNVVKLFCWYQSQLAGIGNIIP